MIAGNSGHMSTLSQTKSTENSLNIAAVGGNNLPVEKNSSDFAASLICTESEEFFHLLISNSIISFYSQIQSRESNAAQVAVIQGAA